MDGTTNITNVDPRGHDDYVRHRCELYFMFMVYAKQVEALQTSRHAYVDICAYYIVYTIHLVYSLGKTTDLQ